MNKSSEILEMPLTTRINIGYNYASGTSPKDKDWERVKEELRTMDVNWFKGADLWNHLYGKIQPVRDHMDKFYPGVTFDEDKLGHFAVSLMLAEKTSSVMSLGLGFFKEVVDEIMQHASGVGVGFESGDLTADLAGAMGWNIEQALAAGLLIDTNPVNQPITDKYSIWLKLVHYIQGWESQSQIDKGTGQKYLTGIKNKINPHYDGGGQALSGYFIYHGGGTPQIHSLSLLPEAPPQGVATPISIQFTWRWDGTTFVNLTHSSHGSISGAEVTEDGETYNRYTITWPNTSIGASENYGYGVSDFINIAAGSFTVTDKNFPSPPGNGLLWHSVPVTISNNITDELY